MTQIYHLTSRSPGVHGRVSCLTSIKLDSHDATVSEVNLPLSESCTYSVTPQRRRLALWPIYAR